MYEEQWRGQIPHELHGRHRQARPPGPAWWNRLWAYCRYALTRTGGQA